jgi:hypothetical protein
MNDCVPPFRIHFGQVKIGKIRFVCLNVYFEFFTQYLTRSVTDFIISVFTS